MVWEDISQRVQILRLDSGWNTRNLTQSGDDNDYTIIVFEILREDIKWTHQKIYLWRNAYAS